MKLTKAESIYWSTRTACRQHIESFGFDGVGFDRMATEELVYKRTVNEIKKLIKRDYNNIKTNLRLNIFTEREAKREAEILKMVELTLENQYIA